MDHTARSAPDTGVPAGVSISGDLSSDEDITVDGSFDGQISAPDHHVRISPSAVVRAKVIARAVTIQGTVDGTVVAAERITVECSASVRGHLTAPSLKMIEGAVFTGTVHPSGTEAAVHVAKYRQKHQAPGTRHRAPGT